VQVNNPADSNTATAMLPWLTVGDSGQIGMFWYGTNVVGDPNNQTIFANAKWKIFYAVVNTSTSKPTVQYVVASGTTSGTPDQMAGVVHYGSICTQGTNCNISTPAGNRELAEYAELTHDPTGSTHIVFSEDNTTTGTAFTWYTKQTAGPGLIPNVGTGAGYFNIGTGTGNFGFLAGTKRMSGVTEGTLNYLDNSAHIQLSDTTGFTTVTVGTNSIKLTGTGVLQSGAAVNFTATATAGGAGTGTFTISWSGYSASGTLVQGQITK
jgi:hypothetical protein